MPQAARTTVASFQFAGAQYPAFQSLAQSFHTALGDQAETEFAAAWSNDRFIAFTVDAAQVILAYHTRPGIEEAGMIAVAVSVRDQTVTFGEEALASGPRRGICGLLAERIAEALPGAALTTEIWTETGRVTPGTIGALLDGLAGPAAEDAAEATGRPLTDIARAARARMAAPTGRRPREPGAFEAANDLPELPEARTEVAARIRDALYAEIDLPTPTRERVALYAMSLTLCTVNAPVGFALLTYNALGRENLRVTARVMSIAGGIMMMANSLVMTGALSL
ncbi:hypothetical protein [Frigidibacter sp. MR17.24]|uniref:hypothetical protein n=1 Tax=Frigidibacter sp. MR17.24 TaxID=3127345 RepID=UPI003012B62E